MKRRLMDLLAASPLAILLAVHPPHGVEHLGCLLAAGAVAVVGWAFPRLRARRRAKCPGGCADDRECATRMAEMLDRTR